MNKLKTPLLIFLAFIGGTLVSLATTLVLANGGDPTQIHSCVKNSTLLPNSANVRIIGLNVNCASGETAVNWPATASASMNGNSFKVYDANNNLLGLYVTGGPPPGVTTVYNLSLNKLILINNSFSDVFPISQGRIDSNGETYYYQSDNCTGNAYVGDDFANGFLLPLGNNSYGVVDITNPTITVQSLSQGEYDIDHDTISCRSTSTQVVKARNILITASPFSVPVNIPLQIKYQ